LKPFKKITPEIVERLRQIVGPGNVIYEETEKLEPYSHDEVFEKEFRRMPEAVVRPSTPQEVSEIMKLANAENFPVTPRGAGSGYSSGAVALLGGIVLSFERMNRILEIDTENLVAVVEPGVVTNELALAVEGKGLFYAGYPMSLETCFIGGNVAENAGGGKAVKYGVTGRYVLGLEVVLPTGEIVMLGGKRLKDVTGYDLIHLLVGSEGTLGIFTKIYLRLLPRPRASADLFIPFKEVPEAIRLVPLIMSAGGILPTSVEFIDGECYRLTCNFLNERLRHDGAQAYLIVEVDGSSKREVAEDYEIVGDLCLENGALEVYVADNRTTQERIWRIRRNVPEALNALTPYQSKEDIVVPIAGIPKIVEEFARISGKFGVRIPCFGHAGDGNLHIRIIKEAGCSIERWRAILPEIWRELYTCAGSLGGTISGEHGIGAKKKDYMPLVMERPVIELMKRVKKAFDPNGVLNPGKIFPDDY